MTQGSEHRSMTQICHMGLTPPPFGVMQFMDGPLVEFISHFSCSETNLYLIDNTRLPENIQNYHLE